MDIVNLQTGDLVVGTNDPSKSVYSAEGKKIREDGVALVGDQEDIARLQSKIQTAAARSGKQLAENKKYRKKGTKGGKQIARYLPTSEEFLDTETFVAPTASKPTLPVFVYFENSFGKIRCALENVIEHEQAFMLVFANEEEIVFEPKVGETLEFMFNKTKHTVYYPGVIFDWTDQVKKVMILFKTLNENE